MGDIIDFAEQYDARCGAPRRAEDMKNRTRRAVLADDPEQRQQKREEQKRRSQLHVLQQARKRATMTMPERKTVARNLFRLLQEAERDGIRLLAVLKKARQWNPGESTKRLVYFRLDPALQGNEQEDGRAALLRVKTTSYIAIAQALAELKGLPENEYILDLFSDTPYAAEPAEPQEGPMDTYVAAFHGLLKEMTETIAVAQGLAGYFERLNAARIPAFRLDPEKYWLEHCVAEPLAVLGPGQDFTLFHGGETGGLPSATLYAGPYGPEIDDRLHISRKPIAAANERFPKLPARPAWDKSIDARIRLWREVRLCICPVVGFRLPQPAFELRRSLVITAGELQVDLRRLCISETQWRFPVLRGDLQFLGRLDREEELPSPPEMNAIANQGLPLFVDWLWFARATQSNCKQLLDRPVEYDMELAAPLAPSHAGETGFPADSIGAAVEEALYDGSLYRALVRDTQRRQAVLQQYCRDRDDVLARRRGAARKLWT